MYYIPINEHVNVDGRETRLAIGHFKIKSVGFLAPGDLILGTTNFEGKGW